MFLILEKTLVILTGFVLFFPPNDGVFLSLLFGPHAKFQLKATKFKLSTFYLIHLSLNNKETGFFWPRTCFYFNCPLAFEPLKIEDYV